LHYFEKQFLTFVPEDHSVATQNIKQLHYSTQEIWKKMDLETSHLFTKDVTTFPESQQVSYYLISEKRVADS